MAQDIFEFGHRKARSSLDLAFLVLVTFLALVLTSGGDERAFAFASPQSPVPPASDQARSVLLPVVHAPDANQGWLSTVWRVRGGMGLIVLGVVLVLGGLLWITNKRASATPVPPDETGGCAL